MNMSNTFLKLSRTLHRSGLKTRFSSSGLSNVQPEVAKKTDSGKPDTSEQPLQVAAKNPVTDNVNKLILRGDIRSVFMSNSGYRLNIDVKYPLQREIRSTMYTVTYHNADFGRELPGIMKLLRVGDNVTVEGALSNLQKKRLLSLLGSYIEKHER